MSIFNFENVESNTNEFSLLKDGVYAAVVERGEWKPTKSNPQNEYLNLQVRLTESNRVIFSSYNLIHTSEQARNIAMSHFKTLLIATGNDADKIKTASKDDLVDFVIDKPFNAKIGTEKSEQYGDKNVLKDALPLEGETPFPTNTDQPF